MNWIDFIIGATLMNSMPHLVLGIWKGRMFSAFGFGNKQNIAYGFLCLIISLGLFIYKYGADKILDNGIYLGALALLLIYFLTGQYWTDYSTRVKFNTSLSDNKNNRRPIISGI